MGFMTRSSWLLIRVIVLAIPCQAFELPQFLVWEGRNKVGSYSLPGW